MARSGHSVEDHEDARAIGVCEHAALVAAVQSTVRGSFAFQEHDAYHIIHLTYTPRIWVGEIWGLDLVEVSQLYLYPLLYLYYSLHG